MALKQDLIRAGMLYTFPSNLNEIEAKLHYKFHERGYLCKSLISKSYWHDCSDKDLVQTYNPSYEPLNTLGDGIIDVIMMEEGLLLDFWSKKDLHKYKEKNVNMQALLRLARTLDLHKYILWGKGQKIQEIPTNSHSRILAEFLEGIIGAIHLDGGYEAAKRTFLHIHQMAKMNL